LAVAAASLGASDMPSGTSAQVPSNDPVAAAQLHTLIQSTLKASSFTEVIRISGPGESGSSESLVYNAPDRLEIFSPTTHQPVGIEVGAYEFMLNSFGPGWARLRVPKPDQARTIALGLLSQLLHVRNVQSTRDGLVTSYVTKTAGSHPVPDEITALVHLTDGYVSEVRLTEHTSDPIWIGHVVDIDLGNFNSSSHITVPVAHAATVPTTTCDQFGSTQCEIVTP
jgi:hypothetical protein